MRSKSKFIKQYFFILFFISFVSSKNYARKCTDVSSNGNQKLAIQAVASQLYLNNLVIRFDETKKRYLSLPQEMKSLTDAIEVGLVDLSKDVQLATETEKKLIEEADDILEYQYSLNEQAASVVDLMLSASVKQKDIDLDLDFEFLDDKARNEVRATLNKHNIDLKDGFNQIAEFYTNEIDELLGYVPGDPYATKASLVASQEWDGGPWRFAHSTSWHPSGDYVVVTGEYDLGGPQLTVYNFDGTSLTKPVHPTGTPGGEGAYLSIDWSPEGGHLVIGGSINSLDPFPNNIRVLGFNEGPPKTVTQLAVAEYDSGANYDVTSVAWHPDFSDTTGGFFAAVGNGDDTVDEIQIYKFIPSVTLGLVAFAKWGAGVNKVYSCSWSKNGEYLAVGGEKNSIGQVLRIFKFISTVSPEELIEVASMNYDVFDFDVDWITGVDWSPNDQYLALSANALFERYIGFSTQIAMSPAGNGFAVLKDPSNVIQALRYDVIKNAWQEEFFILSSSAYDCFEPQIAMSNNEDAIAVWKRDDGGGSSTIQANRYDASTGSWQSPDEVTNLSLSGQNASLPQIVMNDEDAIAVWQGMFDSLHTNTIIQANRYDGSNWQDPSDVINLSVLGEESTKPQIAINDEGDAIVVWRSFDGGDDYSIQTCKYDNKSFDWLSVDTIFSGTFPSIDNPQVAMSNEIAIIVWEGEKTYNNPYDPSFIGDYYRVQARTNIIFRGWGNPNAWEPSLNKEPEDLSLKSRRPQIAVTDYEGIAVWEYAIPWSPIFPPIQTIEAKKYVLGQGWKFSENLYHPYPPSINYAVYPQIAMDGFGNAIVVWDGYPERLNANRYNAEIDSWEGPRQVYSISNRREVPIAMDRAGNAIVTWPLGPVYPVIYAARYNEVTDVWKENLGFQVGRYSLKIVSFDVLLPEPLSLFTAWNNVETMFSLSGVVATKWSPNGQAVAIGTYPVNIKNIEYSLIVFEVDFLSKNLIQHEGSEPFDFRAKAPCRSVVWRPDGKYISAITRDIRAYDVYYLGIFDLDYDYFEVVVDTYDTSVPTRSEVSWSNKGERDVGILSNILRQNQEKNGTKNMPTKFAIPDGYLTAANFVDIINPACISADYGLTAVLDASVEVTNSLLGARTRNCKFMQDNLKLSRRLTDVYKKSIEIKKTEQARIIDQPGVYTFNKDVQGVIVVDADNITLDLNGYKIFSDLKIPITVNKNIKNISIKNGSIIGGNQYLGAPSGVLVQEGAQHITLENLTITFCYEGVTFKGEQDCSVTDCLVQDCAFKSNIKAASLDCSEYVTFKECEFLDCFLETVNLEDNNKNCCQ